MFFDSIVLDFSFYMNDIISSPKIKYGQNKGDFNFPYNRSVTLKSVIGFPPSTIEIMEGYSEGSGKRTER